MLLPNFAFNVIYTGNKKNSNKNNILMMFKQVLFDDFESMLLQKLEHRVIETILVTTNNTYLNNFKILNKLFLK